KAHKTVFTRIEGVTPKSILDRFDVPILLRLGKGDLATQLWQAAPAESVNWNTPYPVLSGRFASNLSKRGKESHCTWEDSVALQRLRLENQVRATLDKEDEKIRRQPNQLLRDQERRAKQKRTPIICIGPNREGGPQRRIAALIERLD